MPPYSEEQRRVGINRLLSLSKEELGAVTDALNKDPLKMLQIASIRTLIASMRLKRLDKRDVRVYNGDADKLIDQAIEHNLDGMLHGWALMRPIVLIYPLVSLTAVHGRLGDLKVLTIGPRTESELLTLVSVGFHPNNITGLDLMSYNTMVDVGDMHDMPYEDESFDIVIAGWVLAYSADQLKAASEILRVVKSGGFVAIGCEHSPNEDSSKDEFFANQGLTRRLGEDGDRANWSERRILDLFGDRVRKVVFVNDETDDPDVSATGVMVIFQVT